MSRALQRARLARALLAMPLNEALGEARFPCRAARVLWLVRIPALV
jgi:hypothetical protein